MTKKITITLPDGSQKRAQAGITGLEIASMIGAGLAKAAIAFEVNGEQRRKVRRSLKRLLQDRQRFLLRQIKAETEKL